MTRNKKHPNNFKPLDIWWLFRLGFCLCTTLSFVHSLHAAPPLPAANVLPAIAAPQWSELEPAQQQALHPLKSKWSELSDVQRRKWIAIVKNFPKLPPADQAKVQERMSAWATLKPIERERARENFTNSKLTPSLSKAGSWEEYQALPKEERDKLASQAPKKRAGAAKTAKPVTQNTIYPHPAPPHALSTPGEQRSNLRNLIAPNTLLPRNP